MFRQELSPSSKVGLRMPAFGRATLLLPVSLMAKTKKLISVLVHLQALNPSLVRFTEPTYLIRNVTGTSTTALP